MRATPAGFVAEPRRRALARLWLLALVLLAGAAYVRRGWLAARALRAGGRTPAA